MSQDSYLLSKFYAILRTSTLVVLVLFFAGCNFLEEGESHPVSTPKEPPYNYVYFSNTSDANITLKSVKNMQIIYETQVGENGSFVVDINSSFSGDDLFMVELQKTPLVTYALVKELQKGGVVMSPLTSLATLGIKSDDNSSQIIDKFSLFAKQILRLSIDDDELIDYRDINTYKPNMSSSKYFLNPRFYEQIESSGFIDALLSGDALQSFISADIDSDGLSWQEELFAGSDMQNADSDADGISDSDEIRLGLNPISKDSDFDGLEDGAELMGITDPRLSDSDGDYFSDSYELENARDPLQADENANGVLDGLDGDPLFKYQWHLQSNGDVVSNTNGKATIVGNDLNILDVYKYQRGDENTIIQVVDTGVELLHEDLNVNPSYSRNSINGTNDPSPTRKVSSYNKVSPFEIGHGTAVAGIAGAIANNGVGVRGVVPNATIAGSNWLEEQSIEELDILWYNSAFANEILVSNNSWGAYMSKDRNFEDILKLASQNLRNGKGRIFTFASGNDREIYGNANLSYIANNRYAITVASLNHENRYSYYSNPGSNILVSGYGGSSYELGPTIATTLLMGKSYYENELGSSLGAITFDEDTNRNYTFTMNGTSAATPMVSGAIALVLKSCPELTWRDVRWLLSYRSKKVDIEDKNWVTNAAGRSHNINYGYGLVDANSMIEECRSIYYEPLMDEVSAEIKRDNINVYIADNNISQTITLDFSEEFTLEWLELTVDSDHPYAGDYEISLISPAGTKTEIIAPNELRSAYYKGGFRFSSAAFMGEKTRGVWRVEVVDRLELDSGTITSVALKIYGHRED